MFGKSPGFVANAWQRPKWVSRYTGDCPSESMINIINLEVNLHIVLHQSTFVAELCHCTLNNAATAAFQGQALVSTGVGEINFVKDNGTTSPSLHLKTAVSSPADAPMNGRVLEWKKKTLSVSITSEVFTWQIIEEGTQTQVWTGKTGFLSYRDTLWLRRWGKMWEMWFLS